jgi:precorrin-6B methylase 2
MPAAHSFRERTRQYWEDNIEGFAGFYDLGSEEAIDAPAGLRWLYRRFLLPIEKRYMRLRYEMVCRFIDAHVHAGMEVADIGCGSGIFTARMALRGARVHALDYTQSALDLVRGSLMRSDIDPDQVTLHHLDVTREAIPPVQAAIAIGVLTYVERAEDLLQHVLPYTDRLLVNFIDRDHLLNRVRRRLPALDVRHLAYHTREDLESDIRRHGFCVDSAEPLATGVVLQCRDPSRAP